MTKVLVIEDELPLCEEIADTLRFEGFNVFIANDGRAGLEMALETRPDLVICDITMPQMDGYTVLLEMRKYPEMAATPFMFLTARDGRSFMRHGMELGADDYLTKPFTRGEFMSAVSARLKRQADIGDSFTREIEEIKTTLTRMVAQELRTPLVSMRMAASIAERQLERLSPTLLKELLADVNAGMNRLNHIAEQMVYLANLESGLLRREAIMENGTVVPIEQILLRAVELGRGFAFRCNECKVRIYARDREASVLAHTQALKHALAELIASAVSASSQEREIAITQWQADGAVWLSVLNEDMAMSPEEREKAVEQFGQQEIEEQNMGLGLLVARGIIEAHSGTLKLQKVLGKSPQITVSLPLVERNEANKGKRK